MVCLLAMMSSQVNAETVKNGDTDVRKKDGFDIININTPNNSGVSINKLNEFNVKEKGTVINIEANHKYETVRFGQIDGNKNITSKEADIAVFEVNRTSNTTINSTLGSRVIKSIKSVHRQ